MALARCGNRAVAQLRAGWSCASYARFQSGFGGDGFGGPPQGGFGDQGGFGGPQQGGFGGPQQGGFGGPPQGGFGGPPQGGFGGPPQGGFGGPPQGGFGGPPQGGFGGPPMGGFGGPPRGGFGGPPQGGFGGPGGFAPRRPMETAPIPDKPPYGLHLARVSGMSESDIMSLFKDQNPTEVKMMGETNGFIYFTSREDLVAALERSGSEAIRFIRVSTSMRIKRIAEIPDDGPFKAHVRALPPGMTQEELLETFKEMEPTSCIILQNRMTLVPYAFVEFASKENLLKALDLSFNSSIRNMVVNPAVARAV